MIAGIICFILIMLLGLVIFANGDAANEFWSWIGAGIGLIGLIGCMGLVIIHEDKAQEEQQEREEMKIVCEHEGGIIVEDQCRELGEVIDI